MGLFGVSYALSVDSESNATQNASVSSTRQDRLPTIEELLYHTNQEREKVGLKPLVIDARLNQSAQLKAEDMVAGNYFGHENPVTKKHGYEYAREYAPNCKIVAENLSAGNDKKASGTVDAWMRSKKGHREAILNSSYDSVGFGISDIVVAMHFCDLP